MIDLFSDASIIILAEIKLNKSKLNMDALKLKSQRLLAAYPEYKPEWIGLSIDDAGKYIQ